MSTQNQTRKVQTRICPVCNTVHDLPLCERRSEERSGLTQEDHLIFRARTTVAEQARLLKADRQDAYLAWRRANAARYGGTTIAAEVAEHERQFGALYDLPAEEPDVDEAFADMKRREGEWEDNGCRPVTGYEREGA